MTEPRPRRMPHRRLFPWIVGALLVVVGWLVLDEQMRPTSPTDVAREETVERQPDYFIEDFHSISLNESGEPAWELRGPRMLHFIDEDLWTIQSPDMLYHVERGEPWRLVSDSGRAWSGLTEAVLEGEVLVSREAGEENDWAELETTEAWLFPQERLVQTQQPATYRTRGAVVDGVGARGALAINRINLLSEVKSRYAPETD